MAGPKEDIGIKKGGRIVNYHRTGKTSNEQSHVVVLVVVVVVVVVVG